jgi:hypothetical protein
MRNCGALTPLVGLTVFLDYSIGIVEFPGREQNFRIPGVSRELHLVTSARPKCTDVGIRLKTC